MVFQSVHQEINKLKQNWTELNPIYKSVNHPINESNSNKNKVVPVLN
jgi:hypothetical protein